MTENRHIVIVGGGIIGSSIAYFLSRAKNCPAVTLLEASKSVAPGASGKSGGFLAVDWHGPSTASLAALSYELHRKLAEENNGAERWGYRQVTTHNLRLDTSRKPRSKPEVSWMNHSVFTSSSPMGGGGSTAQVTPGDLTQFLAEQSQASGVQLRLQTKAVGIETNENKVQGIKVESNGKEETIPATDVVVATGYVASSQLTHSPWTGKLLSQWFTPKTLPPFLRSAAMIDGSRAHSIVIQAAKNHQLSADCFFSEMSYGNAAGAPELYIRPKGVAYISGGSDDEPLPELADDVTYNAKTTAELQRQAAVVSPEYLDVKKDAELLKEQAVRMLRLTQVLPSSLAAYRIAHHWRQRGPRPLRGGRPLGVGNQQQPGYRQGHVGALARWQSDKRRHSSAPAVVVN